jgi:hypothetical protein
VSYVIWTSGHEPGPPIATLEAARQELAELVAESLAECRRKFGQATKVRHSEDSYTVTIGDRHSVSIWATHSIIKL